MIVKLSKRALKEEAERLGAIEILGRKSNIYNYENARYNECKKLKCTYEGVAYSAGIVGNTGRIDKLTQYDPKSDSWHDIKYIYYVA